MIKKIVHFFDVLEDFFREKLSHYPIIYALLGGIGVVLFWRGIWHTADSFPILNGPVGTILGALILLLTGIFVSAFIGNRILLTGLRGEKKLAEKTQEEIDKEDSEIKNIEKIVTEIQKEVSNIKKELE